MAGISSNAFSSLDDPAPMWRFECDLPVLTADGVTVRPPSMARIQKVSLPFSSINDDQAPFSGHTLTFPTNSSIENISLTVLEDGGSEQPLSVLDYWLKWRDMAQDQDGNMGLPIDYWKTITIRPVSYTGKALGTFRLTWAWPKVVTPLEFDGESAAVMLISVTLNCYQCIKVES